MMLSVEVLQKKRTFIDTEDTTLNCLNLKDVSSQLHTLSVILLDTERKHTLRQSLRA